MDGNLKQLVNANAKNIALVRAAPAITTLIIGLCTEVFCLYLLLNPQTQLLRVLGLISILTSAFPFLFLFRAEWKVVSIVCFVLIAASYTYLSRWYQWVVSIENALNADNIQEFTIRLMEEGFRTRVQFFRDKFPRRKFPDRIAFKENKITESYGHKIQSKAYLDSINDEPFLIQTDKDFILLEPRWLSHPFSLRPY